MDQIKHLDQGRYHAENRILPGIGGLDRDVHRRLRLYARRV